MCKKNTTGVQTPHSTFAYVSAISFDMGKASLKKRNTNILLDRLLVEVHENLEISDRGARFYKSLVSDTSLMNAMLNYQPDDSNLLDAISTVAYALKSEDFPTDMTWRVRQKIKHLAELYYVVKQAEINEMLERWEMEDAA